MSDFPVLYLKPFFSPFCPPIPPRPQTHHHKLHFPAAFASSRQTALPLSLLIGSRRRSSGGHWLRRSREAVGALRGRGPLGAAMLGARGGWRALRRCPSSIFSSSSSSSFSSFSSSSSLPREQRAPAARLRVRQALGAREAAGEVQVQVCGGAEGRRAAFVAVLCGDFSSKSGRFPAWALASSACPCSLDCWWLRCLKYSGQGAERLVP